MFNELKRLGVFSVICGVLTTFSSFLVFVFMGPAYHWTKTRIYIWILMTSVVGVTGLVWSKSSRKENDNIFLTIGFFLNVIGLMIIAYFVFMLSMLGNVRLVW